MKITSDVIDLEGLNNVKPTDRTTDGAGKDVTIGAGDALGTDQTGGILNLNAGRTTGTGWTEIRFGLSDPGATGSALNDLYTVGGFGYDGLYCNRHMIFFVGWLDDAKVFIDTQYDSDSDGKQLTIAAGEAGTGGTGNHTGGDLNLYGGAGKGTSRGGVINAHSPIQIDVAPTGDTVSGTIVDMVAAEPLVYGDVCYVGTDGKLHLGDATTIATATAVAMATETIDTDLTGRFLLHGIAHLNTLAPSWTVGGLVYLSLPVAGTPILKGQMTQVAPSGTDEVVQILGVALATDVLMFNPQLVQIEHA